MEATLKAATTRAARSRRWEQSPGGRFSRAICLSIAALALAAPARAQTEFPAGSETAASGIVSARLSWDAGEAGPANPRLEITRNGGVAFSRAIPKAVCDGCVLVPDSHDDLRTADLDGDGEAEVVVSSYTGGLHCCTIMGVYGLIDSSGGYSELVQDWQSSGFELKDLDHDGGLEVSSRDIRFEDLFTSHFASFPPPAVFEYERPGDLPPKLTDATTRFPAVIRANAAEAKRMLEGGSARRRQRRGLHLRLRRRPVHARPRLGRPARVRPPGQARGAGQPEGGEAVPQAHAHDPASLRLPMMRDVTPDGRFHPA